MGGVWTRDISPLAAFPDAVETVTISPVQTGYWVPSTETFTSPGSVILLTTSPDTYGFVVFDLYTLDANGNPTAPRGIELDNMILGFQHSIGGAPSETLRFYIVPQARAELYSATNPPFTRGENIFGAAPTGFMGQVIYGSPGNLARQGSLIGQGDNNSFRQDNFRRVVEDPLWNGRICVSIDQASVSGNSFIDLNMTLIFNSWSGNTGWIDAPNRRRTRAVHDYKMGYPALSDEFVPDGFLEGIKVHRDSWDPEDPDPTYIGSPLEGVVDDEIPNLEE